MGLTEVVDEVQKSGERRAQEIIDEAQAEASEILARASDAASDYEARRVDQADRDSEQILAQAQSHAEFEARKLVLEGEAGLRRELREKVLAGFGKFPAPLRESHLEKLARRAREVIPKGKVWGAAKDKDFLSSLDGYKFAGTADIAGGLIVESNDGRVRLDLSYDTLLGDLWRDILRHEAELFG